MIRIFSFVGIIVILELYFIKYGKQGIIYHTLKQLNLYTSSGLLDYSHNKWVTTFTLIYLFYCGVSTIMYVNKIKNNQVGIILWFYTKYKFVI